MDNFIIPGLDPKTSFEISSNKTKKLNSNDTSLNEAAERFEALFLSQMLNLQELLNYQKMFLEMMQQKPTTQ